MIRALPRLLDRLRSRLAGRVHTPAHCLGLYAEDLAHRYLEQQGYRIIDRNWFDWPSLSEIDLVARHGDELVFIEVKARATDAVAPPQIAMHAIKRAALLRGAGAYARRVGVPPEQVRFDVVTIVFGEPPRVSLYQGVPLRPRRRGNTVC